MDNISTAIWNVILLPALIAPIVLLAKRRGWFQNKKLIFVGDQQYRFVYLLIAISLICGLIPASKDFTIDNIIPSILFALSLLTSKFRHNKLTIALLMLGITSLLYFSGEDLSNPDSFWFPVVSLISSIFCILLLMSIKWDNSLAKKSWSEAKEELKGENVSDLEMEKVREYMDEKKEEMGTKPK